MSIKLHFYPFAVSIILVLIFTKFGKTVPTNYDQRQDGHLNVHAKLDNLLFIIVPSRKQMNNLAELAGLLAGSKSEQSLFRQPLSKGHQKPEEPSDGAYRIEFLDFRNQDQIQKEYADLFSFNPFVKKDSNKVTDYLRTKSLPRTIEKHKEPYKVEILTLQNDVSKTEGESIKHEETIEKEEERRKEPYKVEIIKLDEKLPIKSNKSKESLNLDHINVTENPDRKVDVVIVEGAKLEARKAKQYGFFDTLRNSQFSSTKTKKSSTLDTSGRKHPQQQELKLIGDGVENCGPLRHRNKAGICVFD